MGMDNVFPGLEFNPDVHGGKKREESKYDVSWNQEVILVQHEFTIEELDKIQKVLGKDPSFLGRTRSYVVEQYNKVLSK